MKFFSTNNKTHQVSFQEAVLRGLPPDNGLYMPEEIPRLPEGFFQDIDNHSLPEIATHVISAWIKDEIPAESIAEICTDAFSFPCPIVKISESIYSMELFHGPTWAFKDFGARFMSRVMNYFLAESGKRLHILVATSGDTGGAVAHGFLGSDYIDVTILYPSGKVSPLQEKQLTTLGQNIRALEIDGTFDDCQRLVKTAFLDRDLQDKNLSSANSINISRLLPQSIYYFWAYAHLGKPRDLVFSVPSGNFGNISGGLLAYRMGLPVKQFLAATNVNNIVPEYLLHGHFTPRPSIKSVSNAMDVGNPSNYARLSHLFGQSWNAMRDKLSGFSFTDEQTLETLENVFRDTGYIMDPHGAIAFRALEEYRSYQNFSQGVFLETAHPIKFSESVEPITGDIPMPEGAGRLMERSKEAIAMKNSYADFKEYLTGSR